MAHLIHPLVLYALCVLGGAGVCLALPRGGRSPQILGALLAGLIGGAALVVLGVKAGRDHPNLYFYAFALIGLGSALRVITHPRPVYAALYFILTVIATAGFFVLLSAEFMAFALIIVYAGAILITYLFVIMLATQAPEEGETEVLAGYDTTAREPVAACVVGFLVLAVVTTMLFRGVDQLTVSTNPSSDALLADMPRKAEIALRNHGLLADGETVARVYAAAGVVEVHDATGGSRKIERAAWPEDLQVTNVEAVGFNLLRDHPGAIEIAGVILLMAMLGAVVLSREQVQLGEEAKKAQAHKLAGGDS